MCDDEKPTLRERWYWQDLARHPDCRDPDHPGCLECEPPEEDDDDGQEGDQKEGQGASDGDEGDDGDAEMEGADAEMEDDDM
jgi:hypothetical protein